MRASQAVSPRSLVLLAAIMGNLWLDWEEITLSNPVVRSNLFGFVLVISLIYGLASYLTYVSGELDKEREVMAKAAAAKVEAASGKRPKKVD